MAYRSILAQQPSQFDALHCLGVLKAQQGQTHEALDLLSAAVKRRPDSADALAHLGAVLVGLQRHEEALACFDQVLNRKPRDANALYNRAVLLGQLGRVEAALSSYGQVLAIDPDDLLAWFNRANLLAQLERYEAALADYERVLAHAPETVGARLNRGNVLVKLKRFELALFDFDRVLTAEPQHLDALNNRGVALKGLGRVEEALAACDRALAINPHHVDALITRGNALLESKSFTPALECFERALIIEPNQVEALYNRGLTLHELMRYEPALASYTKALAIKPDYAEALKGLGNLFFALKQYNEAIVSYDMALAIKPGLSFVAGRRLHTKMLLCDWSDFEKQSSALVADVRAGRPAASPFELLSIPSMVGDHLKSAQVAVREEISVSARRTWQGERYAHDRIRVAYVSADFREHPVAHLLASVFEQHDRERFETVAIALGHDDRGEMRARLQGAFERFIDVDGKSDGEVARLLREHEVDIAVDLMGFTSGCRPTILAYRSAPIQVNYLSYPGIVGTDFIDYIIADRYVIPEDQRAQFSEPVVYLPDSYLAYDTTRKISDRRLSRAELGMPETGFVFCAYNNSYKIKPAIFDIWMRLLRDVEGSVLWLMSASEATAHNLRREAAARGVDPGRLIFAQYAPRVEDHLARYRVADLFLDTLPFNAQTTACDALWAGLPVLTCLGETFVGRVAASLLSAVGLPELITHSVEEYETLALKLACEPVLLAEIRAKLARNRDTHPLFDTARFTRHIETAYTTMWEICQRGEAPKSFAVAPIRS